MSDLPFWPSQFTLSDFSDLAQAIIAAINLFLAGYIIFYQINKDRNTERATALLNEQNIKLQWFKELIVQPNVGSISRFYDNLSLIREKITSNDLSTEERESINNYAKGELSQFRKSFVDVLLQVDPTFATETLKNVDELIDSLTEAIFNEELKLALPNVYEKNIGSKIFYSRNSLIAQLYNYKGV